MNSVGSLPTQYLKLSKVRQPLLYYAKKGFVLSLTLIVKVDFLQADEVEAVLANTKQILNQFLRKSRILPEQVYPLEL
jgi:hypothetical protein